jgi:predicted dinucleotide-binding enzyme
MTPDERHVSALVAACAKEASAYILAYARDAGLDPIPFGTLIE